MNQRTETAGRISWRRTRIAASACLLVVAAAAPSTAHLQPPDLWRYGPFTAGSVHCLRLISRATQYCFRQALALQRGCADQQLTGGHCDRAVRDTAIAAVTQTARAAIDAACFGGQLTELSFSSFDEVKADATRACSAQAIAVMSMAYPHAAAPQAAVDPPMAGCMARTAAASQTLLRTSVRLRSRSFDRMAMHLIGPSVKTATMARVDAYIAAVARMLATKLAHACPSFVALYGVDPLAFFTRLAVRGDCIVSGSYVQNQTTCPTPVCGNGIQEPGEQCDDGNLMGGDGCSSTCLAEAAQEITQ